MNNQIEYTLTHKNKRILIWNSNFSNKGAIMVKVGTEKTLEAKEYILGQENTNGHSIPV